ncbi:hypothetical protein Hanom_Chr11g01042081 [Helianthus anomalus]
MTCTKHKSLCRSRCSLLKIGFLFNAPLSNIHTKHGHISNKQTICNFNHFSIITSQPIIHK